LKSLEGVERYFKHQSIWVTKLCFGFPAFLHQITQVSLSLNTSSKIVERGKSGNQKVNAFC
jgi:hypothetical protein